MIFKSLLLTLGLLQNQGQAALLSVNKTSEADKALEVCLASDAWMYRTAQEDFARDWEEMKSFLTYAVPASFALSAFFFSKEDSDTEDFLK
jgi:hypothetical protein